MKIEFLIENIEKFLPLVSKVIPVHSQIPILSNVLLEVTKQGFYVSTTSLEIGVKIKVPAKIEEEGATTVPGKQFIEALSSLPKDKVSVTSEKDSLRVKCRDNNITFQTIAKDEFPNILEQKGEKVHTFSGEEIKEMFEKLTLAASLDDSRPELTGILISQKDGVIDFVATDGFRLSLKKIKKSKIFSDQESIILPARLIIEAMSLSGDISLYIYKKGNQVVLENEEALLIGRLINGEFPNYERVIPTSFKTSITLDVQEFLQKLRLTSIFARDAANIVKISVSDGKVRIIARSSGVGEGEAVIEGEQKGKDNEIAFNIKFLMDLLRNIQEKTITIELSSPVEPATFRIPEDPDFLHIIMPVRLQE
ncbi:MAG: DNA polymerase III subunit beta [Candidatus Levybacteria bacterium]|nr:DNA polymerase III subunit beta [Candidatus Levybacteria bacterium]